MSSFINRRAALGVLGLGGAAFLAACGSAKVSEGGSSNSESSSASESASPSTSSSSASPSASPSSTSASPTVPSDETRGEHVGDVKFHNYAGDKGSAKVGTEEQKTTGLPKPNIPEGMDAKTKEGFYKFAGYWVALWNYSILTGDVDELLGRMGTNSYNAQYEVLKAMYENENGWVYYGGSSKPPIDPLKMAIKAEPVYKGPESDTYAWYVYPDVDSNMRVRNLIDGNKTRSNDKSVNSFLSLNSGSRCAFLAKYVDGKWKFLRFSASFNPAEAGKADINS